MEPQKQSLFSPRLSKIRSVVNSTSASLCFCSCFACKSFHHTTYATALVVKTNIKNKCRELGREKDLGDGQRTAEMVGRISK